MQRSSVDNSLPADVCHLVATCSQGPHNKCPNLLNRRKLHFWLLYHSNRRLFVLSALWGQTSSLNHFLRWHVYHCTYSIYGSQWLALSGTSDKLGFGYMSSAPTTLSIHDCPHLFQARKVAGSIKYTQSIHLQFVYPVYSVMKTHWVCLFSLFTRTKISCLVKLSSSKLRSAPLIH